MRFTHATHLFVCAVVLHANGAAYADVTMYRHADRDQWFADSGGIDNITTLDFTGFPIATTISDQYSHFGVTFEGFNQVVGPSGSFPDGWGLSVYFGNILHFDEPIYSFGTEYLGTYQLELYLGDTHIYTSGWFLEPGLGADFGGVISTEPFDRVIVYDPFDELSVFDNMYFGPPINVPAPPALTLLVFAPMMCRRRRRRHPCR